MKQGPGLWSHAVPSLVPLSARSLSGPGVPLPAPLSLPPLGARYPTFPHPQQNQPDGQQQSPAEVCQHTGSGPSLKAGSGCPEWPQPLSFSAVVGPAHHGPHTLFFSWCFTIRCLRKLRPRRGSASSPQATQMLSLWSVPSQTWALSSVLSVSSRGEL